MFSFSSLWPSPHLLIRGGSEHFGMFLQHWRLGSPFSRSTNAHVSWSAQCERNSCPKPWHCEALRSAPFLRQDLCQSVVKGLALSSHSPVGGEYQWAECCVFYFKHSPAVLSLLLICISLEDLLRRLSLIPHGCGVNNPYICKHLLVWSEEALRTNIVSFLLPVLY